MLRLRYNISTGEFGPNQGYNGNSVQAARKPCPYRFLSVSLCLPFMVAAPASCHGRPIAVAPCEFADSIVLSPCVRESFLLTLRPCCVCFAANIISLQNAVQPNYPAELSVWSKFGLQREDNTVRLLLACCCVFSPPFLLSGCSVLASH